MTEDGTLPCLTDGPAVDVEISGAVITAVRPVEPVRADRVETPDCGRGLPAPSVVEGHLHLDKTLLGLPHIRPRPPGRSPGSRRPRC